LHLECFIGDRAIDSTTPEGLRALSEKFNARSALLIAGKGQLDPQDMLHR
jgi:hypothetical protein